MPDTRVRFAPSPTGFFHIGSARTALFNWLFARHSGGKFILRIEDTDAARNSEEFVQLIYDSLRWLGLNWDEGPDIGGAAGPYRQSERDGIYRDHLQRLRDAGRTYEKDGAVFFRISGEPQVMEDAIRGRVVRTEEKDFVIVRSDGKPVFHLVNVVDDIAMGITHVIRGEDHLSNTSKHTELFKAFGAPLPIYAHIPLILKESGPGKMSKRDKGALVEDYRRRGFLSEAVVNYLCLLGWSPKDDSEKMPLEEIVRRFDLSGINQSNARFDEKKMAHMNMAYFLELPADRFLALAREHALRLTEPGDEPFKAAAGKAAAGNAEAGKAEPVKAAAAAISDPETASREYFDAVVLASQPKIKGLEELPAYTRYFFTEDFAIDPKAREKVMAKGDPKARLRELAEAYGPADFSSDAALEQALQALAAKNGLGVGDYIHPGRLALSGSGIGLSFYTLCRLLGRERVMGRIGRFVGAD